MISSLSCDLLILLILRNFLLAAFFVWNLVKIASDRPLSQKAPQEPTKTVHAHDEEALEEEDEGHLQVDTEREPRVGACITAIPLSLDHAIDLRFPVFIIIAVKVPAHPLEEREGHYNSDGEPR